jgi:hypothetical protein
MSPDDRIYWLVLTWVSVVAAVVYAIVVARRWRQRPWTVRTHRTMASAVVLALLAGWFTILHLN